MKSMLIFRHGLALASDGGVGEKLLALDQLLEELAAHDGARRVRHGHGEIWVLDRSGNKGWGWGWGWGWG